MKSSLAELENDAVLIEGTELEDVTEFEAGAVFDVDIKISAKIGNEFVMEVNECDIVDKSELESDMIVTVGEESSSDFEVDIEYNMTNVKTVELVSQFDTDSDKENVISWEEFETYMEEFSEDTLILDHNYVTINRSK